MDLAIYEMLAEMWTSLLKRVGVKSTFLSYAFGFVTLLLLFVLGLWCLKIIGMAFFAESN